MYLSLDQIRSGRNSEYVLHCIHTTESELIHSPLYGRRDYTQSMRERRTRARSNCKLLFTNWGSTSVFEWDSYEKKVCYFKSVFTFNRCRSCIAKQWFISSHYEPVWLRVRSCVLSKTQEENVWLTKESCLLCIVPQPNRVWNAGRWKV